MAGPYVNACPAAPGLEVRLPSGATIRSTHTAILDIPSLSMMAVRHCHLFPELDAGSLISIGQLCDHGCRATFDATHVNITCNDVQVLTGSRSSPSGLWHADPIVPSIPDPSPPLALMASSSVADRVAFYHASLFSLSLSTLCKAIDSGFLATFPELTSAQVHRHPPFSIPHAARPHGPRTLQLAFHTTRHSHPDNAIRSYHTYSRHLCGGNCQSATGRISSDLTGRFLQASSQGNQYLLIVYDYDSNYIHAEPLPSRSGPHILLAYKAAIDLLKSRGLTPRLQRLDNEASQSLQQYLAAEQIDYQLVPPHIYCRNTAECAIRTFKNHFIAGLCGTDRSYPLHLWNRLLPQALLTLNLLRASRLNPRLSAHAQVHGAFAFNRTPFAPAGTCVMVHKPSSVRGTWAPHAVEGWYVGPALHHYRCHKVWMKETAAERSANRLTWFFPTYVTMPVLSSADAAAHAAHDLIHALLHPAAASPLVPISAPHHTALLQLAAIFSNACPTAVATAPTAPVATFPPPDAVNPVIPIAELPRVPLIPIAELPRVPMPLPPMPAVSPIPVATPRVVVAAPPPPIPTDTTYGEATINPGRRRRARARREAQRTPPPPAPVHPHNTRNRGRRCLPGQQPCITTPGCHFAALCAPFQTTHNPEAVPSPPLADCCSCFLPSANAVLDAATGSTLSYRQLQAGPNGPAWEQSAANEIGRLAQGVLPHMPHGTDTMHFIAHSAIPADRIATYLRIVAEERPLKVETRRVRCTVGGNLIHFPGNVSTPTADLTTIKILINSVLSTPGAKFGTGDIANFYLNNPMERFEYMRIPVRDIPPCIMKQYNLAPLVHNGHVMVEICKGMYGLPLAGIIANTRLLAHLATADYHPVKHTAGLFSHATRPVSFCLTVDDFGVKYVGAHHAEHLFTTLRKLYTITTDWSGTKYCGLTLQWDYTARTCDMSMPGYVAKAQHHFQHPTRPDANTVPTRGPPPSTGPPHN